jgi:AcrR family transcriptional regulator
MARPRFHKLAAPQQQLILDAALREFAAHGFADASLNRIIEAAGISKGSMYYYFDGKEDLYAHVIRDQLERLVEREGPFPAPSASDPDEFWDLLAEQYLRLMRALMASPEAAALLRGWLGGGATPSLSGVQREAEQEVMPWVMQTLAAGQQIGAIRTDLPAELLIAVVMGMGQAVDIWLINSTVTGEVDLEAAVHTLLGMMRRALAP